MTNTLISNISGVLKGGKLPGEEAQLLMSPSVRVSGHIFPEPSHSRSSGVMVLLYPNSGDWSTVFIERTLYGPHGGQISLPGGKREKWDADISATALRETMEEIGVDQSDISVIGGLTPLYVPHSNFRIYPFVGFIEREPNMVKNDLEVKSIVRVGIGELFDKKNKGITNFYRSGFNINAPYYNANGHLIWGATAMIMSEFEAIIIKQ